MKKRAESNTQKRANAMASRTKDNLKVLKDGEGQPGEEDVKVKPEDLSKKSGRTAHEVSVDWLKKRQEIMERMKRPKEEKTPEKDVKGKGTEKTESESDRPKLKEQRDRAERDDKSHRHSSKHGHRHKSKHKHKRSSRDRDAEPAKETPWTTVKKKSPDNLDEVGSKKVNKKQKPRKLMPPPMSYQDILKLAQLKETNPTATIEPDKSGNAGPSISSKKPEKPVRPMTQDEKDRAERMKSKEYQHWLKFGGKMPSLSGDPLPSMSQKSKSENSIKPHQTNRFVSKHTDQGAKVSKSVQNIEKGGSKPLSHVDRAKALSHLKANNAILSKDRPKHVSENTVSKAQSSQYSKKISGIQGKCASSVDNGLVCKRGRESSRDSDEDGPPRKVQPKAKEPEMSTWDRIYGQMHSKPKARPGIYYCFLFYFTNITFEIRGLQSASKLHTYRTDASISRTRV